MLSATYGAAALFWVLSQPTLAQPNLLKTSVVLVERQQGPSVPPAQPGTKSASTGREFFVSWGYNGDSYAASDLHIRQPSLGNHFTLLEVRARDSKGWTDLFNHSLTVPQYNLRFGMFFSDKWGLEVAYDHMKWIVRQDQQVRMTGRLNNAKVDADVVLTPAVLKYQLNNGTNPIFVNVIRRVRLLGEPGRTGSLFFLAKMGGGIAIPHTENVLFGEPNEKGFQFLRGWNMDAVAAARVHLFRGLYFEFEEKLVYVKYFNVKVDRGTAEHSLKANEFVLNFGMAFR